MSTRAYARALSRRKPTADDEKTSLALSSSAREQDSLSGPAEPASPSLTPTSDGAGHNFGQIAVQPATAEAPQMKRRVSQPGDPHEREADEMAERVMRMAAPTATGADGAGAETTTSPVASASAALDALPAGSSGQPLDAATRAFMEPRLGHDFGQVRVHRGEPAAEAAANYQARAYTVGRDIVFGAGEYAPETREGQRLLAHELTHVVQQGGDASAAATVQRDPDTKAPAAPLPQEVAIAVKNAPDVRASYRSLFDNQRSGLARLHDALQKKEPDSNLIANLAAVAVGVALTAVLGPVGPAAEALVVEEDELGRSLVKKSVDLVIDKAKEGAQEGVKKWLSEPKTSDPIDNFIEAQSIAINNAEKAAIKAFDTTTEGLINDPHGLARLQAIEKSVDDQADSAASQQLVAAAGAWASLIAAPGDDSKAWANDDYERYAEKGALEIEAEVKNAPISGPGDIKITGSNWKGINKETERVVQEHHGAIIRTLGVNLRIIVSTPWGETRCEISPSTGNPVIPEKSNLQRVLRWLATGEYNGQLSESDRATITSAAAVLGYYIMQKDVSELKFD